MRPSEGAAVTGSVDLHYDAANKRNAKITNDVASATTTTVLYAGDLYRRTEMQVGGAPSIFAHHVRVPTPDGLAIEGELGADHVASYQVLHGDYLGSTIKVSSTAATMNSYVEYSPFGEGADSAGTWSTWTGLEWDDEFGLYNMRGRMYDPTLGRFVSPDPIVGDQAATQAWNRYSYVANSPMNAIDPSGFDMSWFFGPTTLYNPYAGCMANFMSCLGSAWGATSTFLSAGSGTLSTAPSIGIGQSAVNGAVYSFLGATAAPALAKFMAYQAWVGGIGATGYAESMQHAGEWRLPGSPMLDLYLDPLVKATPGASGVLWLGQASMLPRLRAPVFSELQLTLESSGAGTSAIPELAPNVAKTFANGEYVGSVLAEDLVVFRAEGSPMGRWFGTTAPETAAHAEQMYNVVEYGNDLTSVSKYVIPKGTPVYTGAVAGGTGTQIFVSDPVGAGVRLLQTTPLTQYGF